MTGGNQDVVFLNLGGSGIDFKVKESVWSINFLPSLIYTFKDTKAIPALGFGPQWHFKKR